jgi:16S rRNA (guanine527-N7)-methyltransferase
MPTENERLIRALRENATNFGVHLSETHIERLSTYYSLLMKWNPRLHLVAPCSPEEFATRHILESLTLLPHLAQGARVTDVGSGAGLPLIPCLIVRGDLCATLIESSQKKGVFLQEALRHVTTLEPPRLLVARFEDTPSPSSGVVTCRALDQFQGLLPGLINWAPPSATFLLFAGPALRKEIERLLPSAQAELIPGSEQRFLIIAKQNDA